MLNADAALLKQLSENSLPYRDPLAHIDWETLDGESYWLPETAITLYGLPEFQMLSPDVRRRLSQYEFLNVMHCGLWLESVFLQRLARRLHPALPRPEYEFLLHELREETGHSLMFLKAIETSRLPLPEGTWRAPRLAAALARWAPAGGDLFWLAMAIGEDVPDRFNRWLRQHGDALHPAVRQICTLHVVDEARHITFARGRLECLLKSRDALGKALLAGMGRLLLRQLAEVFFFPPAGFYELAGLPRGAFWRRLALRNPARRLCVAQCLAPTLRMLEGYGLKSKP